MHVRADALPAPVDAVDVDDGDGAVRAAVVARVRLVALPIVDIEDAEAEVAEVRGLHIGARPLARVCGERCALRRENARKCGCLHQCFVKTHHFGGAHPKRAANQRCDDCTGGGAVEKGWIEQFLLISGRLEGEEEE